MYFGDVWSTFSIVSFLFIGRCVFGVFFLFIVVSLYHFTESLGVEIVYFDDHE